MRLELRRAARGSGVAAFVAFEALISWLSYLMMSVRCCSSSHRIAPGSAGEWIAVAIFIAVMLLLGAVIGGAVAMLVEALARLIGRISARRRSGR
jgi:hypothetical protein